MNHLKCSHTIAYIVCFITSRLSYLAVFSLPLACTSWRQVLMLLSINSSISSLTEPTLTTKVSGKTQKTKKTNFDCQFCSVRLWKDSHISLSSSPLLWIRTNCIKSSWLSLVSPVFITFLSFCLSERASSLPELTPSQKNKLRHLSIISLASNLKVHFNSTQVLFLFYHQRCHKAVFQKSRWRFEWITGNIVKETPHPHTHPHPTPAKTTRGRNLDVNQTQKGTRPLPLSSFCSSCSDQKCDMHFRSWWKYLNMKFLLYIYIIHGGQSLRPHWDCFVCNWKEKERFKIVNIQFSKFCVRFFF